MKKYIQYIKENISLTNEWFQAIEDGNIKKVKELINQGIDINIKNNHGNIALIDASCYGEKEIVKLLLNHPNIDVNIQSDYGYTALINASYKRHKEIVKLLLNHPNIDVNIQDNFGYTALMYASRDGYNEIIELLLK
jgi:ankyrin repeat protein